MIIKTTKTVPTLVKFNTTTPDSFYTLLLESLNRKESRYSKVVSRMNKDDKYYKLAKHILMRTQEQIVEVESAYYEYTCKMEDRLEKGNI